MRDDLASVLVYLRPQLRPELDYRIGTDDAATGPVIRDWFADPALRPSDAAIAAVTLAQMDAPGLVAGVIAERDRRLALGFDYDFTDARGIHRIGTTDADMAGWDEVSKFAAALQSAGQGAQAITIVTDTGPAQVTADEWALVLIAAGQFRQPVWAASFALQAMDPIPATYADDAYWP